MTSSKEEQKLIATSNKVIYILFRLKYLFKIMAF